VAIKKLYLLINLFLISKAMFKIGIQKGGRLTTPSIEYLASLGIEVPRNGRELMILAGDFKILFLRQKDIPEFVERGIIDFGIVGTNAILEKQSKVDIIKELGFCKCSLVIAGPSNISITALNGERIATSFPNLLRSFLQKNKINASIIEVQGSVEVIPAMGLADAVCDLVQTGSTLKDNNLVPIATVLESQAVLISNPNSTKKWRF